MVRLMEILCQDVVTIVKTKLGAVNLLKDPIAKVTKSNAESIITLV
jgi:hypothetical protein